MLLLLSCSMFYLGSVGNTSRFIFIGHFAGLVGSKPTITRRRSGYDIYMWVFFLVKLSRDSTTSFSASIQVVVSISHLKRCL